MSHEFKMSVEHAIEWIKLARKSLDEMKALNKRHEYLIPVFRESTDRRLELALMRLEKIK